MIYFKQCSMQKPTEGGYKETVSWIPEKFAVLNKALKLKDFGEWVNGWVVKTVGDDKIPQNQLPDINKLIRGHKKRTGDSLPKDRIK